MAEPTLALQRFIRSRLIADPDALAALGVSEAAILSQATQPDTVPAILIGKGHTFYGDYFDRDWKDESFVLVEVWAREKDMTTVKLIADAIRRALRQYPWTIPGFTCTRVRVEAAEFARAGKHSEFARGVVTVSAILQERAVA